MKAEELKTEIHIQILKELNAIRGFRRFKINVYYLLKLRYIITQKKFISRLINLIKWLYDRNRSIYLHSHPLVTTFESNVGCNLECPYCVTGSKMPTGSRNGKASYVTMKTIIDKCYTKSFQIAFHNNGEPFLNEAIFAGIKYAYSKGLWTCVHSNLNNKISNFADNVVNSKLNNLVVSCDGASQEVYQQYRKNGNINLVFENIENIVKLKKLYKSKFPWITAKFHIFDHNWHEIKTFKNKALASGADDVIFLKAFSNGIYTTGRAGTEKYFNLKRLEWENIKRKKICSHMWSEEIHIDYNGGIMPCGNGYHEKHLFVKPEDTKLKSIMEQLNTNNFITVRKYFLNKSNISRDDLPLLCKDCNNTIK